MVKKIAILSIQLNCKSVQLNFKKNLQITQNKVVRSIIGLGPRSHISQTELDRVDMLCIEDRSEQLILNTMFDIFHNIAPPYLSVNFSCTV